MDTTSKILFAVGGLLAVLVAITVAAAVDAAQVSRTSVSVVVARTDIAERTLFTGSNIVDLLTARDLPVDAVPKGALRATSQAIGKITTRTLVAGEVVMATEDRLTSPESPSARPAATIPRDKVAIAIAANDRVRLAGAMQQGDRVDVITTWGRQADDSVFTELLFQDVRVFAVGRSQSIDPKVRNNETAPTTVTLLVDYQQAVVLEYLLRTGGHISLVLRRFDQAGEVGTDPVTADMLLRRRRAVEANSLPR